MPVLSQEIHLRENQMGPHSRIDKPETLTTLGILKPQDDDKHSKKTQHNIET